MLFHWHLKYWEPFVNIIVYLRIFVIVCIAIAINLLHIYKVFVSHSHALHIDIIPNAKQ